MVWTDEIGLFLNIFYFRTSIYMRSLNNEIIFLSVTEAFIWYDTESTKAESRLTECLSPTYFAFLAFVTCIFIDCSFLWLWYESINLRVLLLIRMQCSICKYAFMISRWTAMMLAMGFHWMKKDTHVGMYAEAKPWLNVFQTLAIMEVWVTWSR